MTPNELRAAVTQGIMDAVGKLILLAAFSYAVYLWPLPTLGITAVVWFLWAALERAGDRETKRLRARADARWKIVERQQTVTNMLEFLPQWHGGLEGEELIETRKRLDAEYRAELAATLAKFEKDNPL
jgi:hypothetical protein